jgi:hypothetical protein
MVNPTTNYRSRAFTMSRLTYSFDNNRRPDDQSSREQRRRPLQTGLRSQINFRKAAANTALFAFGFGSMSFIAYFSGTFLLLYLMNMLRH